MIDCKPEYFFTGKCESIIEKCTANVLNNFAYVYKERFL